MMVATYLANSNKLAARVQTTLVVINLDKSPSVQFELIPLHAAQDIVEHANRCNDMRALVQHDALGAL